ncbi:putative addiction module killer protein [Nitrosomonas sp. Nm58]|nr:putative addiction module killer protein [Nitrosomonas sp. Nm58]
MVYGRPMRTIYTTDVFDEWFSSLRDKRGKARIEARLRRVEQGNLGDAKPIGKGVSELRIDCGPGYRVYLAQRGIEVVVLLAGGDKSTQEHDIKTALELARKL